jgi:3-deoxy-D-manno-octulosonic-acid transferase
MFFVYALLVHVAFVILLPVLLVHPKLREGFLCRLGWYPPRWPGTAKRRASGHVFWFHGASAGDLAALQPVILLVRDRRPEASVVVTTVTNSGMAMARKRLQGADAVGYLPYDLPLAVRRAVKTIRPDILVLEYAEVWPALIRGVKRSGARIVIINGRFHERALPRYRWFYRLIGNPLKKVDLLCMRDPAEAEHALSIGAPPDRVRVTGNTKFDSCRGVEPDPEGLAGLAKSLGIDGARPVLLAGSTHEGEEGPLLDVYLSLRESFPDLHLVVAPRYIERADRIASMARERGLDCALRSTGATGEPVVVLDSVGELRAAYRLATVVFVGGSFVRRGGQNILEPAACGKPVLFGPHMENFRDSVKVLLGRGGIQVTDFKRFKRVLSDLLSDSEEILKLGGMARESVSAVQGASLADAEIILKLAQEAPGR